MSRTDDENAYTGTPGREDQGEDRAHGFEGFPPPPHGGAPTQNPRRGGWNDPEAVQAVFLDMQRRMDEMEQQLRDQGKTQQDQNAQIPQHQPATATSGVDPTVRPPPVILPPTRLQKKLKEVKRVLVRVLPPQLHYGIDSSVDTLQKLMQELELRACRQPDLKLAPPDISNEITESWKNSTQNSTINAVSTATTAPPAAATATASADPATVNPTPPPQPTVAATASNTKTKDEDNEPTSRVKENSYRSKKGDKRKPQRGQRQQQHQRQYQQQQQQRGRGNDNRIGPCHTCGRLGHRRQECHYSGLSCHNCGRPGHLASVCRQWQQKKKRQHSPRPNK